MKRFVRVAVLVSLALLVPAAAFADCWCEWSGWHNIVPTTYCCSGCNGGVKQDNWCDYICDDGSRDLFIITRCKTPTPFYTCC